MIGSTAQQASEQQALGVQNGKVVGHKRKALTDINPNTASDRQLRPKASKANGSAAPVEAKVTRSRSAASQQAATNNAASECAAGHSSSSAPAREEAAHKQGLDSAIATGERPAKSGNNVAIPNQAPNLSSVPSSPAAQEADANGPTGPSQRLLAIENSSIPPPVEEYDIDGDDMADQFAVAEYTHEIYHFLREREVESMVAPDYMSRQDDINSKMRVILTDWLVEVHLKFKLRNETLFLCFQLMDRFLQDNVVVRNRLQLVGVTAMMIASKYEEIYPPEMRDFVYICDNAYTKQQILDMEQLMLEKLKFALSFPTPWSFMNRFCKAAGKAGDKSFTHLVSYISELAQIDYSMLKYAPSLLVASSVAISNLITMEKECWPDVLAHHCKYTLQDLSGCIKDCLELMSIAQITSSSSAPRFKAVFKKFSHSSYSQVTDLDHSHVTDTLELLLA